MPAVRDIQWESALMEPRPCPEFEQRMKRETGRPGAMLRFTEGSDWLCDTTIRMSVELSNRVHLDADLGDEVGLVVSQDNSCRFCFGAQRMLLRCLGMKESRIVRLEQDLLTGDFTARERAALKFTRRMSRSAPLATRDDVRELQEAGFQSEEITELVGLIGVHLYFNRLATLLALPPEELEEFPDRWWCRLARPVMGLVIRRGRKSARPTHLTPEQRTGPFATIVNALDGLPVAGQLRTILDGLWASEANGPRAVPLIFAVVARSLGCSPSEAEARRLLVETGLPEDEVEGILTHLSSPMLDEREREIAPMARDTVWYDPAPIQRRMRDMATRFSRPQMLEFIGTVAVANAVCRMGVLDGSCA